MKRWLFKICRSNISNLMIGRSLVLLILICTLTIGAVFSFQSGIGSMEMTQFLPIILKPAIYQTDSTDIYWNTSDAPYPVALAQAAIVEVMDKEFLYLVGGAGNNLNDLLEQSRRVTFAAINEDGSLGDWSALSNDTRLDLKLYGFSATAVNELLYVFGGFYYPSGGNPYPDFSNGVYCAKVNPDGSFDDDGDNDDDNWKEFSNNWGGFSGWYEGVAYHSVVTTDSHIYLIGGYRRKINSGPYKSTPFVFSAKVDGDCKDLEWTKEKEANNLPVSLLNHTAVSVEISPTQRFIYVFGGLADGQPSSTVYRAQINPDGSINEWDKLGFFPGGGLQQMTAVQSGDYLYVIGGRTDGGLVSGTTVPPLPAVSTVYRAKIMDDSGNLSTWEQLNDLDKSLYGHAAAVSDLGRIYITGGRTMSDMLPLKTVFWTPLLFFSKNNDAGDVIYPGEQIKYNLTVTSNNVRDIAVEDNEKIIITDTLPTNLQFLFDSTIFTQNGQLLTAEIPTLLINQEVRLTFTAEVLPQITPSSSNANEISASIILPQTNVAATPIPTASIVPHVTHLESSELVIRPTIPPGCLKGGDDVILSGTPRPKPTCTPPPPVLDTPTPVVSATATPSGTLTSTLTPTVSITPTISPPTATPPAPTPTLLPVLIMNQASVCFEGYCKYATAVNAPFRTYLPIILR